MSVIPESKEADKVVIMACKMTDRLTQAESAKPGKEKARAYGRADASIGEVREAVQQYRAAGGEH